MSRRLIPYGVAASKQNYDWVIFGDGCNVVRLRSDALWLFLTHAFELMDPADHSHQKITRALMA